MTCPNRDGHIATGGCIFCSEGGSGDFAAPASLSISKQIRAGQKLLANKRPVHKYIAYFQAFTNTYGPVDYLRSIFTEAIQHPEIEVLAIATRPDCLQDEIVSLLSELNQIKPVWVELGLQTMHEDTAQFIRRGYPLPVFEDAVKKLRLHGIEVITHVILGLPGEDHERMLETIRYLNTQDIQGIKLQLLHILKGTDLADIYEHDPSGLYAGRVCLFHRRLCGNHPSGYGYSPADRRRSKRSSDCPVVEFSQTSCLKFHSQGIPPAGYLAGKIL